MSKQKHSAEPWRIIKDGFAAIPIYSADNDEFPVCSTASNTTPHNFGAKAAERREADARRIVACVNACEGISTKLLEEFPRGINGMSVVAIGKMRDQAQAQRDELLAALKSTLAVLEDWDGAITQDIAATFTAHDEIQQAREAIAKAEGQS